MGISIPTAALATGDETMMKVVSTNSDWPVHCTSSGTFQVTRSLSMYGGGAVDPGREITVDWLEWPIVWWV